MAGKFYILPENKWENTNTMDENLPNKLRKGWKKLHINGKIVLYRISKRGKSFVFYINNQFKYVLFKDFTCSDVYKRFTKEFEDNNGYEPPFLFTTGMIKEYIIEKGLLK